MSAQAAHAVLETAMPSTSDLSHRSGCPRCSTVPPQQDRCGGKSFGCGCRADGVQAYKNDNGVGDLRHR